MTDQHSPTVLIFRKRLLAYSETFIAAQGRHLPTWQPVFTGLTADQSGLEMISSLAEDPTEATRCCLLDNHCRFPMWSGFCLKRLGRFPGEWRQALERFEPRLIHAHFGPDALTCLPIARAMGLPLIATFHGFDICIEQRRNAYMRNRHMVFFKADVVIAVSDFIAGKLRAAGCPSEKIVHHAIGIDLEGFPPMPHENRQDILFVGRLVEKKGCADLIAAMHILGPRIGAHRLHIVGDGPLLPTLRQAAQGLGERVLFHGRQPPSEVQRLLAKSALFCVPSVTGANGDAEGLGMVFLEAQAMGTPVVSTQSGGIPEAVLHEHSGLLVEERQTEQLAQAIARLLNDEGLRRRYAAAGIDHVHARFDVRRQSALLEDIYSRCCDHAQIA